MSCRKDKISQPSFLFQIHDFIINEAIRWLSNNTRKLLVLFLIKHILNNNTFRVGVYLLVDISKNNYWHQNA